MGIRIPQNKIQFNYTSGKEYILLETHSDYQGYYYELNGKYFVGKTFLPNSPELIKSSSDKVNPLLTNPLTKIYGLLSNININKPNIPSIPFTPTADMYSEPFVLRYFVKKNESSSILIKEVNKDTFQELQKNPFYQTLEVKFSYNMTEKDLSDLDKKMTGIKIYLQDDINNIQTSSDETDPFVS